MEATKSSEIEAMMVPTRVSSRLQNLSKIQYNIYNSSGNKVFAQHVEKIELESTKESLVTTTKVCSQLQNRNKIPDDINHKRGMIDFDDNIVEKIELGSKEENLVSTTKGCSQLQIVNKIPDDINHKRGMIDFDDNIVEKFELGSKEENLVSTTKVCSQLQIGNKISDDINHKRGMIDFDDNIVEKIELESKEENLVSTTKGCSQLQIGNKISDDIIHKRGMIDFDDNIVEKIELGSKEENLVSTTKVCSQLQIENTISDDINHKRGMNSFDDNIVEKRTKLNSLRRKPGSHSSSRSAVPVFDGLDFRGILSLRETSRLANLGLLAKQEEKNQSKNGRKKGKNIVTLLRASNVEKNGIDNEYVPGITTSKYLINKLRELAKVGTYKVHLVEGQVSKALSSSPSLVCKDISNGQEAISIIATNDFDDPPVAPTGFEYITSNKVSPSIEVPSSAAGCNCKGSCRTKRCSCANHNGSEFSYNNNGRLIEPRDIVVECGPQCGCGPKCGNKISQQGLSYRLEVYRTPKKGWAVRTWDFIPSGAPVVEYIGVLSRDDELGSANGNDYIFDIDCLHTINGVDGRERRLGNVPLPINNLSEKKDELMEKDPEYCIDAGSFGNVSRFINHGCEPNLFVQCVLSSHRDPRLARVVLFAADDIPPYQELTYDYGYTLDSVSGSDGKIKQLQCHCGAKECRKRLY